MKILILIIASLLLIRVESKDGYPMTRDNCLISCGRGDTFCNTECNLKKASRGYCSYWEQACYCHDLPEDAKIWEGGTIKCAGK
uniref:NaTx n=1 Tax=Centruroides hentzi TaxID=88313 RepID=A0A2I9LP97_9SCOR